MLTAACAQIDPSKHKEGADALLMIGSVCSLLPPAELSTDRRTLLPLPISQSIRLWSAPERLLWWDNGEGLLGFAGSSRRLKSVCSHSTVSRSNSKCWAGHHSRHFKCVAFYTAASLSVEAQRCAGWVRVVIAPKCQQRWRQRCRKMRSNVYCSKRVAW